MKPNKLRRITAAALVLALVLPQGAVAAPPEIETDEAVYINLDPYGIPEATRIVKGVNLNGHTEFTDYGDYTEVYNMSTYDQPTLQDGSVSWALEGEGMHRFYYECIPESDTAVQLPWNFDISYKLNGVPVEAEKCAGASGLVEINIHATPNEAASEYYKNNMMLICGTGIDMSKALSIEAPGAQIQSMGTYKLVVFMGLPGEENTFTVRIGSDYFENMGLLLFMAPATLSSLDILSDLREVKNRFGESGDSLYEGLSGMLNTLQSMQSGLGTLSDGISGIDTVRRQLIADRGELDPQTDAALDALEALAGNSDSLIPELNSAKTTLTTLNATVNSMLTTLEDSAADVTAYQELLRQMHDHLKDLQGMLDDLHDESGGGGRDLRQLAEDFEALGDDLDRLAMASDLLEGALDDLRGEADAITGLVGSILDWVAPDAGLSDRLEALVGPLNDVVSETADLLDAVSNMTDGSSGLGSLSQTAGSISENFGDILDILEDYETLPDDAAADGQRLTELADQTLERVNDLIADIPALSATLDQMTKDATSALDKGETLMVSLTDTLSAASELLRTATDDLRAVRDQSDAAMQKTLDGLIDVLGKAANEGSSNKLKQANDGIHSALEDAENELEGETNMLNLDADAALQSVTSDQNPTPASVQFILRTQEIAVDETEAMQQAAAEQEEESALDRIVNIFRELWDAVSGVFAQE